MRRWALALAVGCAKPGPVALPVEATVEEPASALSAVAQVLEPIREANHLPALAAAVVGSDGVISSGAVGLRRVDGSEPVTVADRWHLGSDTKAMTATVLAMVVEDGIVSWDTTLAEIFSGIPVHDGWATVTLDELLHHVGGGPGSLVAQHGPLWGELWKRTDGPEARAWLTAQLLAQAPTGPRGTFTYSNAGYMIVGAALERLTGRSWQSLMRERLFTPLGMEGCGFGAPTGDDAPWGHAPGATTAMPPTALQSDNPVALGPAGTVHCTLADWAAFARLHLDAALGHPRLLSAETFARMHTPVGPYAHGWGVLDIADLGGTLLVHDGSNTMWYASIAIVPAKKRAYLVTSNMGGPGAAAAAQESVRALATSSDAVPSE